VKTHRVISTLFVVAALYDGLLGAAFLVAGSRVMRYFDITPPIHPGYIQFPAALLIVFAVMFIAIAARPAKNRNLIPYGMLLKVSYCSVVTLHWVTTDLPGIWKPFCIFDFVFLALFAWAWAALRKEGAPNQ
jgi:hypothetical protein